MNIEELLPVEGSNLESQIIAIIVLILLAFCCFDWRKYRILYAFHIIISVIAALLCAAVCLAFFQSQIMLWPVVDGTVSLVLLVLGLCIMFSFLVSFACTMMSAKGDKICFVYAGIWGLLFLWFVASPWIFWPYTLTISFYRIIWSLAVVLCGKYFMAMVYEIGRNYEWRKTLEKKIITLQKDFKTFLFRFKQ